MIHVLNKFVTLIKVPTPGEIMFIDINPRSSIKVYVDLLPTKSLEENNNWQNQLH